MEQTKYDIFISYKRKSLPTANNLYYRLTTRGYSTFFDLEEMGRDNFNVQLLNYIESAKDVFVILEEGSLDACKKGDWEKDWFCHEVAFALEKKKNIIPILLGGYKMPSEESLPEKLKELSLKNAPEFNFSFFEAYLDKLIEKDYLLSKPNLQEIATSVFKFYSNENCQVFKEGKLVCSLEGMSDEPYYLLVPRKGDYRFKGVNIITKESKTMTFHIDANEEKVIEIAWGKRNHTESNVIQIAQSTIEEDSVFNTDIFEETVCSEVCAIFCNAIVYIDQLCGVNNDILSSWHKYCLKQKMSGGRSHNVDKKMLEEILFRKKEVNQLSANFVPLSFQSSDTKSIILQKHKISTQEVEAALKISDSTENEIIDNLDFLINLLNKETNIESSWLFAENRLKCFQHEANGLFYGALEGMCSFPPNSLSMYEQLRSSLKYLPTGIGIGRRKEDYTYLQDLEFKKAEDILKSTEEMITDDEIKVEYFGDQLFSRQINVFFAGSKALQTERDIYSNVVSQLQTKWKDNNIHLYGYSFQNFEHEFVVDGHQFTYNEFIKGYSDIIIFVLNGNVGGKTQEEFDIAMNSFRKHRRPLIYVYSRLSDAQNEDVEKTRKRIVEESQYWQDYSDNDHLRLLIKNDLSERLQKVFEEIVEKRREILE